MAERVSGFHRKAAASLLVVAVHVLIIFGLSRDNPGQMRSAPAELVSIDLTFSALPLGRQNEIASSAADSGTRSGVSKSKTLRAFEPNAASNVESEQEFESRGSRDSPPLDAAIDWRLEAQRAAYRAAAAQRAPSARAFGSIPVSPYRPCVKRESSFVWNPEPKKAGFEGGVPYLMIGKRCVIALTGFGCALGALPPANGTLFDDLKTENRGRSSVPDIDDCVEAPPMKESTPESRPDVPPHDSAR